MLTAFLFILFSCVDFSLELIRSYLISLLGGSQRDATILLGWFHW